MNYKNITAQDFIKLQEEKPDAVTLDVRTAAEVRQGKIPGATNLDITARNFSDDLNRLDKDKIYLIYCRSGARSGQACEYMEAKGFKQLYNLSGGISNWPYKIDR